MSNHIPTASQKAPEAGALEVSEVGFTPGPWRVGNSTVFHGSSGGKLFFFPIEADEPFAKDVAYVREGYGNCVEDSRLIAAAPSLAEYVRKRAEGGDEEALRLWRQALGMP